MQLVKIYATGSCNPEKKQGYGHAILSCNGTEKHVAVALDNTTVNRCIIHAIIASVRASDTPNPLKGMGF